MNFRPKLNPDIKRKLAGILQSKNKRLSDALPESFRDFIISYQQGVTALNPGKMYPEYSSVVLELGCGWGEFALEYALAHPDSLYLALDKKKYRIKNI